MSAMAVLVAGCVVSDPPNYGAARQSPPFLELAGASPSTLVVTTKNTGDTVPVSVDFRSEDAGEALLGLLYLNWSIEGKQRLKAINIFQASTIDQTRKVSLSWPEIQSDEVGCQQLSLLVFHPSTGYDAQREVPLPGADVAQVTWWFNVVDLQNPQDVLLSSCPNVGGS